MTSENNKQLREEINKILEEYKWEVSGWELSKALLALFDSQLKAGKRELLEELEEEAEDSGVPGFLELSIIKEKKKEVDNA